jgi:hypothetical protein
MSQDIGNPVNRQVRRVSSFSGGSFRGSGGLVVAVGVEGELAEELADGGVDDAYAEVLDEPDQPGRARVVPRLGEVVVARDLAQGRPSSVS